MHWSERTKQRNQIEIVLYIWMNILFLREEEEEEEDLSTNIMVFPFAEEISVQLPDKIK